MSVVEPVLADVLIDVSWIAAAHFAWSTNPSVHCVGGAERPEVGDRNTGRRSGHMIELGEPEAEGSVGTRRGDHVV